MANRSHRKTIEIGMGWWFNFINCECRCPISGDKGCDPRFHGWISTKYAEDVFITTKNPNSLETMHLKLPTIREYVHEQWIKVDGLFERGFVAKCLIELHREFNLDTISYWHDQGCGQDNDIRAYFYPYAFQCGSQGCCIDWIENK